MATAEYKAQIAHACVNVNESNSRCRVKASLLISIHFHTMEATHQTLAAQTDKIN